MGLPEELQELLSAETYLYTQMPRGSLLAAPLNPQTSGVINVAFRNVVFTGMMKVRRSR